MNSIQSLLDRINRETSIQEDRNRRAQQARMESFNSRARRYRDLFLPALDRLKAIWFPRVEFLKERFRSLAQMFGESVKVMSEIKPNSEPHSGEVVFTFDSPLARIQLKLGFFHDSDVRHVAMDYDLHIVPVLLQFEPKARLEQAVEAFDENRAAEWLDDRIVAFVRIYLAIHDNSNYVAEQMVEDPIARMRFPKYAAEATLQKEGITYYFISPETKREFQNGRPHDNHSHLQETLCEVQGP